VPRACKLGLEGIVFKRLGRPIAPAGRGTGLRARIRRHQRSSVRPKKIGAKRNGDDRSRPGRVLILKRAGAGNEAVASFTEIFAAIGAFILGSGAISAIAFGLFKVLGEKWLNAKFEERLADCGPLAYRVARGVLRNTADAEDVAQEALLRAYRQFHRLRDPQRFRGWLVRIAFRLALDRARSARRREQRETAWALPVQLARNPTAEDLAASTEFQVHMDRALEDLPDKLRLVLLLCAMEGYTLEEVAAMLGVPVGTVKSRLFVARKKLAEKLRCHVSKSSKR